VHTDLTAALLPQCSTYACKQHPALHTTHLQPKPLISPTHILTHILDTHADLPLPPLPRHRSNKTPPDKDALREAQGSNPTNGNGSNGNGSNGQGSNGGPGSNGQGSNGNGSNGNGSSGNANGSSGNGNGTTCNGNGSSGNGNGQTSGHHATGGLLPGWWFGLLLYSCCGLLLYSCCEILSAC
jgi:hypothetical protein